MKIPGHATKDISDVQVCLAYLESRDQADAQPSKSVYGMGQSLTNAPEWPYQILARRYGHPEKVCFRAMERAERRGYIDCGVSLRAGWVTEKGRELIREACAARAIAIVSDLASRA